MLRCLVISKVIQQDRAENRALRLDIRRKSANAVISSCHRRNSPVYYRRTKNEILTESNRSPVVHRESRSDGRIRPSERWRSRATLIREQEPCAPQQRKESE